MDNDGDLLFMGRPAISHQQQLKNSSLIQPIHFLAGSGFKIITYFFFSSKLSEIQQFVAASRSLLLLLVAW